MSGDKNTRIMRVLHLAAFPALMAGMIMAGILLRNHYPSILKDMEGFGNWVRSAGIIAPVVFIGIQFIQVLVFIIPGEIPQIAGGYVFGILGGTFYSSIGIAIGSVCNFILGRIFGVPFIEAVIGTTKQQEMERIVRSQAGQTGMFILFLIPGIPKDALCYAAGLSELKLLPCLLISFLGRLPALIGSSVIGAAAARRDWFLLIAVSVVVSIIVFIGVLYRERLGRWIRGISRQNKSV